jgi:hypothetical protein
VFLSLTLAGTAALCAAPILGARQEGGVGFMKGLGAGLLAAVVLPTVGCCVGVTQIIRGAVNTPEAVHEANAGKRWNHRTREWVREDLVRPAAVLSHPIHVTAVRSFHLVSSHSVSSCSKCHRRYHRTLARGGGKPEAGRD